MTATASSPASGPRTTRHGESPSRGQCRKPSATKSVLFNPKGGAMATTWLDFKELRERLDFAAVLKHFGVELKVKKRNQHQGFCPLPTHQGHKRSPSFSAQLDRKIWKCFGCGASGNVIDFGSRMMGL